MIKQFKNLTKEETDILLKAPILVSVLAISGEHEISKAEKGEATKLAHLKTFTAETILMPYYKEVEKRFNYFFETIVNKYSPFNDAKREVLKEEINVLNVIISKLDNKFASTLHRSLSNYAEHVKKADKRILDTFIFPIPIKGLTD